MQHQFKFLSHLGGALEVHASFRGGSNKGGRLILDELDCRRFDGEPKNRFACEGLEHFRFAWSDGDNERASRLIALKSLIGLGDREC